MKGKPANTKLTHNEQIKGSLVSSTTQAPPFMPTVL